MAMNIGATGGAEPEVMIEINTTPLIDVMLVLLIMLIITIPIQLHSLALDAPQPAPPPVVPPAVVALDVDADGTVRWDGEALADRDALEQRLRQAAAPGGPEVHLKPDPRTAYKHVAAVLAAAQRLGVTRLGIVDQPGTGD